MENQAVKMSEEPQSEESQNKEPQSTHKQKAPSKKENSPKQVAAGKGVLKRDEINKKRSSKVLAKICNQKKKLSNQTKLN